MVDDENHGESNGRTARKWSFLGASMHVEEAGEHSCLNPLAMRNNETGETVNVRCGTRSEKKCAGCSWLYKKDTAKILRSGLVDGAYRYFFLTLTAPSFGRTHLVPKRGERRRCRCGVWHDAEKDIDLRGVPLDCDRYDYAGQALFNYQIGKLWNATLSLLRKDYPKLSYAKVYEWQQRGALHAHIILRIPSNEVCGSSESGGPAQCIAKRAVSVTVDDSLHWGTENDCREIKGGKDTNSVIGYLKKAVSYVTKDVCEERSEGRSRNAKHIIMLEYAARCMHCDKCERIREGVKERIAETEMNLGKLQSDAEAVPVARHAEEIRRYLRIAREGLLQCDGLPHRRWGARAGVMSTSRKTSKHAGWSIEGLTRKKLAETRREWHVKSLELVDQVADRIRESIGGAECLYEVRLE